MVAGPTTDGIYVLVPDSTTCTADKMVIGLRLGPAENLSAILPREDLHLSLCENSLRPTLIADRRVYWAKVTPLLQRGQSVNDTGCPHCHRIIRVNMSRHLRASHTDNQCFWRCPVSTAIANCDSICRFDNITPASRCRLMAAAIACSRPNLSTQNVGEQSSSRADSGAPTSSIN